MSTRGLYGAYGGYDMHAVHVGVKIVHVNVEMLRETNLQKKRKSCSVLGRIDIHTYTILLRVLNNTYACVRNHT
jgi:hypothetical protein